MTYSQVLDLFVSGKVKHVRLSLSRGYRRVKDGVSVSSYSGRYGTGFRVDYPTLHCPMFGSFCSNRYHFISYYIYIK